MTLYPVLITFQTQNLFNIDNFFVFIYLLWIRHVHSNLYLSMEKHHIYLPISDKPAIAIDFANLLKLKYIV